MYMYSTFTILQNTNGKVAESLLNMMFNTNKNLPEDYGLSGFIFKKNVVQLPSPRLIQSFVLTGLF